MVGRARRNSSGGCCWSSSRSRDPQDGPSALGVLANTLLQELAQEHVQRLARLPGPLAQLCIDGVAEQEDELDGAVAVREQRPDHVDRQRLDIDGLDPGVLDVVVTADADVEAPPGGIWSIAARSASQRSAGLASIERWIRRLAICSHAVSWVLKSVGPVKVRPGRKLVSR